MSRLKGHTVSSRSSTSATSKFGLSPDQLDTLYSPNKNLTTFHALGGLHGLERALRTDRSSGLNADETVLDGFATSYGTLSTLSTGTRTQGLSGQKSAKKRIQRGRHHSHQAGPFADRKAVFLDNHLPEKRSPTFLQLVWMTSKDPTLFHLAVAAALSLAIGLYQTFATAHTPSNPPVEWVEGAAILVAILIIVLVRSINDYQKERLFKKLYSKELDRGIKVIRSACSRLIPMSDVLVGDVVHLEPGQVVPADGILINGHNIACDESSVTGQSDLVHKHIGDDVFHAIDNAVHPQNLSVLKLDPFILSGTTVLEGIGTFLVTAVGIKSAYGKTLLLLQDEPVNTPLQDRLAVLAKHIARVGGLFIGLLPIALSIKFLATLSHNTGTKMQKYQIFVDILILSLTVLIIAIPKDLPLTITDSLAFAATRMLKDNNLVRHLRACETMGNATNICSAKTGTLTQNNMVVVVGTIGSHLCFQDSATAHVEDEFVSAGKLNQILPDQVRQVLKQSIALNSTAFEAEDGRTFVGSNTESALLSFARDYLGMGPVRFERSNDVITQLIPFNATRQCMAAVIQLRGSESRFRVFIKGASEVLLAKCTRIAQDPIQGLLDTEMDQRIRECLAEKIDKYARLSLRTVTLAYRDFQVPLAKDQALNKTDFTLDYLLQDLVFLSCVGIQDPLRPGVPEAVRSCQRAGVTVRMVTGDNLQTAKTVAEQCGILDGDENDIIMHGSQFRALSSLERDQVIPHLKVLARSSPSDKQTLVTRLQEMGEIVAVTGDGPNDAPTLSAADIGFSMGGISGSDIARHTSSIILLTDDFTCIVKAIMWGRAVNDSVKKFLTFHITITITSVVLTVISALANDTEHSVLTAVQLMWIILFRDTLAALALTTDPPMKRLLDQKPEPRSAPLINTPMWKMIVGQSTYQLAVTLILYFAGPAIISNHNDPDHKQLKTLVFNTYMWMQIFNMYNNRQYDNRLNVFEGVLSNWLFVTISSIMIGGQILIAFVGGQAFSVVRLTGVEWAISIVLGLLSLPIGLLIRLIPDAPLERIYKAVEKLIIGLKPRRRGSS